MSFSLSRRAFAAGLASLPLAARASAAGLGHSPGADGGQSGGQAVNPLVKNRADAQVFRHGDGYYYLTGSVPEYDRIVLRRSRTIAGLADAEERVLWRHEASGPMSGFIWAPEVHEIDGRWYAYFAAGPSGGGEDVFRIRTYVLQCDGGDPMRGKWSVLGQFQTPWDSFNLDSTIFVHRGTRYFSWAQREPGIETNSNLYIAPLATPLTLARPATRLTVPTLDWEIRGFKVNEAPAVIESGGRLFMTYSASATDDRYCLGLLSIDVDGDLMDPHAWTKWGRPVFETCEATSVYGPGHNSFTTDDRGRPLLVYHGRDYKEIEGDPLFNPDRHTRVQRLYFAADGTPDFGVPVGNGVLPERLRVAGSRGLWLGHDADRPMVGHLPLAQSQYRSVAQADGTVLLSPILLKDFALAVSADGSVGLGKIGSPGSGAAPTRFMRRERGADAVTFEVAALPGQALSWGEGKLGLAASGESAAIWEID